MLRIAGALCCFLSLSVWGVQKSRWYARRTTCLECWINALMEMERMICDLGMDTPGCLARLCEMKPLIEMMQPCLSLLLDGKGVNQAWQNALDRARFPLKEEELRQIRRVGNVLGRYDGEQQRREFRQLRMRLEQSWNGARQDHQRLGRMYAAAGISAGALVAVLLY